MAHYKQKQHHIEQVDAEEFKAIYSPAPVYPWRAKLKPKIKTGIVILDIIVDELGNVSKIANVKGPSLFHRPAMYAVRQWRFNPLVRDGQAVEAKVTVNLNFFNSDQ